MSSLISKLGEEEKRAAAFRVTLPGRIFWERDRVEVELKLFHDRALNRDLEALCAKVAKVQPRLPDGRSLFFRLQGAAVIPLLDAQEAAVE